MPPVNPKCNTLLKTGQIPCNDSRDGNIALGYPSASHQTIPIQQYSDWVCSSNEVCPKTHENWLHIKERKIWIQSSNDNTPPKPGINKSVAPSEVAIEAAQLLNTQANKYHPSLFKEGDITINDPEFQRPPYRSKTLSLAIKLFTIRFKHLFFNKQRGPDVDWSDRVDKTNNYFFVLTRAVLFATLAVATTALAIKFMIVFDQCLPIQTAAYRFESALLMSFPLFFLLIMIIRAEACIVSYLANILASAVAASIDTYEQLTKKEQPKTPEESFLAKYQRMEHLLQQWKNQRDQQPVKITGMKSWMESMDMQINQAAIGKFGFEANIIDTIIKDIEAWLDRAKKQKQLIDNTIEMTEMPTPEPEANMDNRYHWLAV